MRPGLGQGLGHGPEAVGVQAPEETASATRAWRRRAAHEGGVGHEGRGEHHCERHAVDGGEGGDLDGRRVLLLAVAEQAPGELEEGVGPEQLGGHPNEGRDEQGRGAEGPQPQRHDGSEEQGKDGKGEAEQAHDEDAHGQAQAAVLHHHEGGPVEQAHRRDGAREVAETRALGRPRAGQGEEERGEGDPGHRPVAELREGQGQEHARDDGQRLPPPGRAQSAGSPCCAASSEALKEERTNTPE